MRRGVVSPAGQGAAVMVAVVVVLAGASPAAAEPRRAPPVRLVYERSPRAAACPDGEALRRATVKEMGYDPFQADAAPELSVRIDRRRGELAVEMALRGAGGELLWESRSMRSRGDCGALVEALGLSIAIHLDPEPDPPAAVCPAAPVCPPPVAPPICPPPRPVLPVLPPPPVTPPAPRSPALLLGGGPLFAVELPAAAAPGAALFAGLRWPSASLQIETRAVLPGAGNDQGVRIATSSVAVLVAPCAYLGVVFGCGILEGGLLHPSGADAPPRLVGLAGAGARLGVERHLSRRLLLRGHVDLLGTIARPDLGVARNILWYAPEVTAVMGVDLAALLFSPSPADHGRVSSTPSTKGVNP